MQAVIQNKIMLVRSLIEQGAMINEQDMDGFTALHYACVNQNFEITKILLEYGAKVDLQDKYGNPPLFRAVFNSKGSGGIIQLLLQAGADHDLKNKNGMSPLDLAKTIANYDHLKFFV